MDTTFQQDDAIRRRGQGLPGQVEKFSSFDDKDQQVAGEKYGALCRAVFRLSPGKNGVSLNEQAGSRRSRGDGRKSKKHNRLQSKFFLISLPDASVFYVY